MKILLAPDSFKGSLSSIRFCEVASEAIRRQVPDAEIVRIPLADGGEGTVASVLYACRGELVEVPVVDPMGNELLASYGVIRDGQCAVIEAASASGLPLVAPAARNPLFASSLGTGQMILHALERGCTEIIIGLGGTATNDGGADALRALGFRLLDWRGRAIGTGAKGLLKLSEIRVEEAHPAIATTRFVLAADVDNPLLGPLGATTIYGPQKGATPENLPKLERCLELWAEALKKNIGVDISNVPGAGAAGGMGAGFMGLLGAELRSGFEVIRDLTVLEQRFRQHGFDLVVTGEGWLDEQSLHGKLPVSLAGLATQYGVPVVALCAGIDVSAAKLQAAGIRAVVPITDRPMLASECIRDVETLLERGVERLFAAINIGRDLGAGKQAGPVGATGVSNIAAG